MKKLFLVTLLFALSACAFAQQDYVGRYDAFAGFSYLASPKLNLTQRGIDTQIGVNVTRWLALGFDYSNQEGHGTLLPGELKPAYTMDVDELIGAAQQGAFVPFVPPLPANYYAYIPFSARTQTFTGGPQLAYRHFKMFTPFIHPSIGAIHEHISLRPHDAFTEFLAGPQGVLITGLPTVGIAGILTTSSPSDTTYFYGVGGGSDFNATKHLHLRADIEFVHVYLFSGLLNSSRNSVRLSIGPTFNFGKNVSK